MTARIYKINKDGDVSKSYKEIHRVTEVLENDTHIQIYSYSGVDSVLKGHYIIRVFAG